MTRPRVVVAGLGDSGLLTAIHLARHADVVGVSTKPGLVSGQELGLRLARPDEWARDYRIGFDRFRAARSVRTVHGTLSGLDVAGRRVTVTLPDGASEHLTYDALVVATGVRNGFWRRPDLQTVAEVEADLLAAHRRLAESGSIVVVGGGAAAVSAAGNLAARWPDTRVDLYFPGERALPHHHGRVWSAVRARLERLGVGIHPGHRAELPAGGAPTEITSCPVRWSTGQEPVRADAVIWAVGAVRPNTDWLPPALLDDAGFVRVGPDLRVPDAPGVYAVGDVAATDPLRTSARNKGHQVVAHNVRAELAGRTLRTYQAPRRRWGSVLGPQHDGLVVFAPDGRGFRIPRPVVRGVLQPVIVRWGIYRGIRRGGAAVDEGT